MLCHNAYIFRLAKKKKYPALASAVALNIYTRYIIYIILYIYILYNTWYLVYDILYTWYIYINNYIVAKQVYRYRKQGMERDGAMSNSPNAMTSPPSGHESTGERNERELAIHSYS